MLLGFDFCFIFCGFIIVILFVWFVVIVVHACCVFAIAG